MLGPGWRRELAAPGLAATCSLAVTLLPAVLWSVDHRHPGRFWWALLVVPPMLFGSVVGLTRRGERAKQGAMVARGLGWMVALAVLQVQSFHAAGTAAGYLDFARSPRTSGVLGAWWDGLANLSEYASFKVIVVVPLVLLDLAWSCWVAGVCMRTTTVRDALVAAIRGAPWGLGIVAAGAMLYGAMFFVFPSMLFGGSFDKAVDGHRHTTDEEQVAVYRSHPEVCERLRLMIGEDAELHSVGRTRIGSWSQMPGGWESQREQRTTDVRDVLADVRLPEARYREYLRLLEVLGAYEVWCGDARLGYDCEIHLSRWGTFFRCVYRSFVHTPSGQAPPALVPRPDDPDEERFTPLGDGWFLRYLDR